VVILEIYKLDLPNMALSKLQKYGGTSLHSNGVIDHLAQEE
jgi:hypothetical protein